MKYIILLSVIFEFIVCNTALAQRYAVAYTHFPYSIDGKKWGYCDLKQAATLPQQYDSAGFFIFFDKKIVAIVSKNQKYGLIDTLGTEVLPFIYDELKFCDTLVFLRQANKKWLANIEAKPIEILEKMPNCLLKQEMGMCGGVHLQPRNFSLDCEDEWYKNDKKKRKRTYITMKNGNTGETRTLARINTYNEKYHVKYYEKPFDWCQYYNYDRNARNEILEQNGKFSLKFTELTATKIDSSKNTKTIEFTYYQTLFEYDKIKATKFGFIVKKDNKFGIINTVGKVQLPIEYEYIDGKTLTFGYTQCIKVKQNGLLGLVKIDNGFTVGVPCRYLLIDEFAYCFRIKLPNQTIGYLVDNHEVRSFRIRRLKHSRINRNKSAYTEFFPEGESF